MSEFRRRLMMTKSGGSPTPTCPYVTDGLVFWLDGIEKGNTAGAWTDLIGGIKFTPTSEGAVVENQDNFYFTSASSLYPKGFESTATLSSTLDTTIEVCYIPEVATHCLFIHQNNSPNFLYYKSGNNITFIQREKTYTYVMTLENPYTISLNLSSGLVNGNAISPNAGTDFWNNSGTFYIGSRNSSGQNPFKGTLYSIRIYNKRLTSVEMLANQQVDNQRFNLGLTL